MGLKTECLQYRGQLVLIHPFYGWGWARCDEQYKGGPLINYKEISKAGPFHVRIRDFFKYEGELRGFFGTVEEKNHKFDYFWVVSNTRLVGEWDFQENLCGGYDLNIGPSPPVGDWPHITQGSPIYSGYGVVAESQNWIDRLNGSSNFEKK